MEESRSLDNPSFGAETDGEQSSISLSPFGFHIVFFSLLFVSFALPAYSARICICHDQSNARVMSPCTCQLHRCHGLSRWKIKKRHHVWTFYEAFLSPPGASCSAGLSSLSLSDSDGRQPFGHTLILIPLF